MNTGSEPWIRTSNNLREQRPDYMLGVASVRFPQVPRVYSGSFEQYEVLRCLAVEELAFCYSMLDIFATQWHIPTPAVQNTGWHQWFDCLKQTGSELHPYNSRCTSIILSLKCKYCKTFEST